MSGETVFVKGYDPEHSSIGDLVGVTAPLASGDPLAQKLKYEVEVLPFDSPEVIITRHKDD